MPTRRDFVSSAALAALAPELAASANNRPQPTAPAKRPQVARVENGGLLFTDNAAGVSGVDAGYSLPLGNRTLWLFGDVFLLEAAPRRSYAGGVSNCGLLVPAGKGAAPLRRYAFLTDPKTGLARPLLPNHPDEDAKTRLWPFGGWYDASRQAALLYYGVVKTFGPGPFDFKTVGHGLARADALAGEGLEFTRLKTAKGDEIWWPDSGPLFGAAVVVDKEATSPWLYLVGAQERSGQKRGQMARVRKERIGSLDAYEYFAGSPEAPHWSSALAEAADIPGLTDFPSELSIFWNAFLGGYLAVHSIGVEPRLRLSLAPQPWGPYRTIAEIGAPHRAFEKAFCYAGKEHPELAERNGETIYVTYVDSQRYWLQLLKITLSR